MPCGSSSGNVSVIQFGHTEHAAPTTLLRIGYRVLTNTFAHAVANRLCIATVKLLRNTWRDLCRDAGWEARLEQDVCLHPPIAPGQKLTHIADVVAISPTLNRVAMQHRFLSNLPSDMPFVPLVPRLDGFLGPH
eukprot:1667738-Amphidinium_carterae.1